ncbi:MAG: hypothetical protein M9962_03610 [Oligoflexia bacterium]|nr:hypothetical protein [Oligoflexia bacterium]
MTSTRLFNTKNYILRKILDEIILVPISPDARKENKLIVLNESAAFFYESFCQGLTKEEVLELAKSRFEFEIESNIYSDLDIFSNEMISLGVLEGESSIDHRNTLGTN